MKAIVQRGYGSPGDVLELGEVPIPEAKDDEVLIRVRAASVHADVWHVIRGKPYVLRIMGAGFRRPKIATPGTDVAGIVEAVGAGVTRFQPGDAVFGETIRGIQWINGGAYAEYATAPEDGLALLPEGTCFEQAAVVPTSGLIALANLPKEKTSPGQRVLVNGAAGGVGTLAMQIAKARGAEVTCVDRAETLETMRALGADHVIDYTREDFTQGDARYDLVFDIPGNHPFSAIQRALKPDGRYVLIGHDGYGEDMNRWLGSIPRMFGLMARSPFTPHLPRPDFSSSDKVASMETLRALLEAGKIAPVIGHTYPLAEAAEAIRQLESGTLRGRIVITIDDHPGD